MSNTVEDNSGMATLLTAKCLVCGSNKLGWCATDVCEKCCKEGKCPSKAYCDDYKNSILKLGEDY